MGALLAAMLGVAALTNPTIARATETEAGVVRASPTKLRVSALFVFAPLGALRNGTPEFVVGSVPAFGFITAFDFVPHPNAFVGFAPGYTSNIRARGGEVEARAFNLTLRFGGGFPVRERFLAYGYIAPGYSFLGGAPVAAQGPVIGVHAGALFDLSPTLFLDAELGYEAGFQRAWYGMDIPYSASFFQTSLGVGVRI